MRFLGFLATFSEVVDGSTVWDVTLRRFPKPWPRQHSRCGPVWWQCWEPVRSRTGWSNQNGWVPSVKCGSMWFDLLSFRNFLPCPVPQFDGRYVHLKMCSDPIAAAKHLSPSHVYIEWYRIKNRTIPKAKNHLNIKVRGYPLHSMLSTSCYILTNQDLKIQQMICELSCWRYHHIRHQVYNTSITIHQQYKLIYHLVV